ncbi:hypothetical protein SAMN06296952_0171 [Oscillospiraceae bacterium]|nr:hypothetical protein SAMN06296952_0171 [Oscillospiraceae bacterium]
MAVLIEVRSDDSYLSELLRLRLTPVFPNAYIAMSGSPLCDELREICDKCVILYDGKHDMKDDPNAIPIFHGSKRYVDCSSLITELRGLIPSAEARISEITPKGRSHILLPFTYISEREAMIDKFFDPLTSDTDLTVRIDLMSGLRMPTQIKSGPDFGSLTTLLQRVRDKDFRPEDILDYCNPDIKGFMTPGKPQDPDDVFDNDISTIRSLLKYLKDLSVAGTSPSVTTLSVIEGFRISDTCSLIRDCDYVDILLPSDDPSDRSGLGKIPSIIERSLGKDQKLTVHYSSEYIKGDRYASRSNRY